MKSKLITKWNTLSNRDRRAVIVLAAASVVIFGYRLLVFPYVEKWQVASANVTATMSDLKFIGVGADRAEMASNADLFKTVPRLEMPPARKPASSKEADPLLKFRDDIRKIVQGSGIQLEAEPDFLSRKPKKMSGCSYPSVRLKIRGKCGYVQLLNCLGKLNENANYVCIEKFSFQVDAKNNKMLSTEMILSMYVR